MSDLNILDFDFTLEELRQLISRQEKVRYGETMHGLDLYACPFDELVDIVMGSGYDDVTLEPVNYSTFNFVRNAEGHLTVNKVVSR